MMNKNLLRTQYPDTLLAMGYILKCNPEEFKYFLGNEKKEIIGIEKRSTFDNLDEIPLSTGEVSHQTKNTLIIKICAKFGYSYDYFMLKHSKKNIKARAMYARIALRQGKTIKQIAEDIGMKTWSMYTGPYQLGKYLRKNAKK